MDGSAVVGGEDQTVFYPFIAGLLPGDLLAVVVLTQNLDRPIP